MTDLLEKAIAKVRELPAEDQDALAAALLSLAGETTPVVQLDDDTRAAVKRGWRKPGAANLCRMKKLLRPMPASAYEDPLRTAFILRS